MSFAIYTEEIGAGLPILIIPLGFFNPRFEWFKF